MKLSFSTKVDSFSIAIPKKKFKEYAKLDGKNCLITIEEQTYKTYSQNRAYHALVTCFWLSGCSSFSSQQELRANYILEVGHISHTMYAYFEDNEAFIVSDAIDIPQGKDSIEIQYPESWATISKEKAMQAMTLIMRDMDESGVHESGQRKKYAEILNGMMKEDWYK